MTLVPQRFRLHMVRAISMVIECKDFSTYFNLNILKWISQYVNILYGAYMFFYTLTVCDHLCFKGMVS